jgi:signal transduction histidine kinase/ActR/RegA family two-component response regulator
MPQPKLSRLIRYSMPFGAIVAALLLQLAVMSVLPKHFDFPYPFFYMAAVFATAWFGGVWPGVIGCLITMLGLPLAGGHGLTLVPADYTRLGVFLLISLAISWLGGNQRHARDVLSDANEALTDANATLDQSVQGSREELAHAVEELWAEVLRRKDSEEKLQKQLGRMGLLDHITRAIGERQDLGSIFQVVIRTLEDSMPIDFGCVCLYDPEAEMLTVTCVGVRSRSLALDLALTEQSRISVDQNGLVRCIHGQLVYEPDIREMDLPFPKRLAQGGLACVVAAPLRSESRIFGILVAARKDPEAFNSTDCEFLRQLSEHVAVAAHQSQIYTALQQAYEDLRRTQQAVMEQERLRVLGQMASGIAHDINNALSPVALYTESLLEREPNLSPRTRAYLETTQRAIGDVTHTVGRMREFCRKREPQLVLSPVDLNSLVTQVMDLTRSHWSDLPLQRGIVIRMRTELEANLPPAPGIESEIREALTNLIFNAVDAMPSGGPLVLRTRSSADPDRIHIEVQDAGIGMDAETRRRCLEPFFTTKGERGTGLGLAMVYGVIQRQNAELSIDSVPGQGTTVRLTFKPAQMPAGASPIARPYVPLSRLHILLVDDDPLIIRSLQAILEEDGHAVTTATGGQEGIDILQASASREERFAAVITDLGMPYVDGRKVANAVKAAYRDMPVILLTGWGQRLVEDEEIPENVDRVLNKPPKLHQLRSALAELVPAGQN